MRRSGPTVGGRALQEAEPLVSHERGAESSCQLTSSGGRVELVPLKKKIDTNRVDG